MLPQLPDDLNLANHDDDERNDELKKYLHQVEAKAALSQGRPTLGSRVICAVLVPNIRPLNKSTNVNMHGQTYYRCHGPDKDDEESREGAPSSCRVP